MATIVVRPKPDWFGLATLTVHAQELGLAETFTVEFPVDVRPRDDAATLTTESEDAVVRITPDVWTTLGVTLTDPDLVARDDGQDMGVLNNYLNRLLNAASVVVSVESDDEAVRNGVRMRMNNVPSGTHQVQLGDGSVVNAGESFTMAGGVVTVRRRQVQATSGVFLLEHLLAALNSLEFSDDLLRRPSEPRTIRLVYYDDGDSIVDRINSGRGGNDADIRERLSATLDAFLVAADTSTPVLASGENLFVVNPLSEFEIEASWTAASSDVINDETAGNHAWLSYRIYAIDGEVEGEELEASVAELRDLCLEADVKLIACQMTVDLFDMDPDDFIDGIDYAGATTFFEFAGESDVNLFI